MGTSRGNPCKPERNLVIGAYPKRVPKGTLQKKRELKRVREAGGYTTSTIEDTKESTKGRKEELVYPGLKKTLGTGEVLGNQGTRISEEISGFRTW